MRIYVASSWRNTRQPAVVQSLRGEGHEIYDFRNPKGDEGGFHWSHMDPTWQTWTPQQDFENLTTSKVAAYGYQCDMGAMEWADACLLVMPCGRSAHLELGYMAGRGKTTAVLVENDFEPELMYLMVDEFFTDLDDLLRTWSSR